MTERITREAELELTRARRAGARLAAVQALYQAEQTGQTGQDVIADFLSDRLGLGPEGIPIDEADPDLFKDVVSGVVERRMEIDAAITARLAKGWRMERLDATTRAILRGAVYELYARHDLTAPMILDAYVSLAGDFFEDTETGFINGVLDKIATDLRGAG
jgi:transcription antitermination protein NusB